MRTVDNTTVANMPAKYLSILMFIIVPFKLCSIVEKKNESDFPIYSSAFKYILSDRIFIKDLL